MSPKLSLNDILGKEYIHAVCEARAFVERVDKRTLLTIAEERVDFYPARFRKRTDELVDSIEKRSEGVTPIQRQAPLHNHF